MKETVRRLGLCALLLIGGGLAVRSAAAAVPYPVPHRSWIKLGAVAYQSSLTQAQIDWAASHFDWLDNPHSEFLGQYKADTNAPMLVYDEYYSVYTWQAKYAAMVDYAAAHGLSVEDMLLHYAEATTVSYGGTTQTLPAGSRVLCFYGGSWATDRIVCNPKSAAYQAFNAQWEYDSVTSPQTGGAVYDGIFVDDAFRGVLDQQTGSISSGGTIAEYPTGDASAAFDADLVQVFAAVRTVLGPKGAAGSKLQYINNADYSTDQIALYPYIDGVFREFVIDPNKMYVGRYLTLLSTLGSAAANSVSSVIGSVGLGSTPTDSPDEKLYALALYYTLASPLDYFCRQDSNSRDLQTYAWFGAIEYDVGQPRGSVYTFASDGDYTVYARQFTKALILAKPLPSYDSPLDSSTATTHNLPATPDNPTGMYYRLTVEGARDPTPLTQVSLQNGQGAVLITASSLVGSPPIADFVGAPTRGAAPLAVQFTDDSALSPTAWQWDFGDAGTASEQNPSHTYAAVGTYTVSLTAHNAYGSNTLTRPDYITVTPAPPVAAFAAAPTRGPAPLSVAFTDLSTGGPTSWAWDFGDGQTSSLPNPGHTYGADGTYTVSLTVGNAGGSNRAVRIDYIVVGVQESPRLSASFTATPSLGTMPLAVQFADTSSGGPVSWYWDFGDGATSREQNPNHEYASARRYTVTLTAAGAVGSDTEERYHCVVVTYRDVPPDFWAFDQILACADASIIAGYPDGTYRPTLRVTRDYMAVYFARAASGGAVPPGPKTPTFPDVPPGYWAYNEIEYVAARHIVEGYPDGTYRPHGIIDRAQLAVYIARATVLPTGDAGLAGYTPPETPSFSDVPVTFWAYRYIEYCKLQDIVRGYGDGTYRPRNIVTRDQIAVYVQRAFQLPLT